MIGAAGRPRRQAYEAAPPVAGAEAATCPSQTDRRSGARAILALVAEKTGYPRDMLDLDLDLEADLGVDTVKQAEMFAAIRETYDIPRDAETEAARFPDPGPRDPVRVRPAARPEAALRRARARRLHDRTEPAEAAVHPARSPSVKNVLDLVAEKTGYPKDMLDLDLDLEADLGVDTVKQAEMFAAIRETYNIPRDRI